MKKKVSISVLLIACMLSTVISAKEKSRHIIITKTGSFKINNAIQSSSRNFTKNSNQVYGLEYEWHPWRGLSIGGEFFHYSNDFTAAASSFKAETSVHLFNLKYYFNHEGAFQPFLGIGQGISFIRPTGEFFIGSHSDLASQFIVGFTYKFKYVGIYTEYKTLNTKPEDKIGSISLSEIDASGKGLLIGVNVLF